MKKAAAKKPFISRLSAVYQPFISRLSAAHHPGIESRFFFLTK
jgi:hypothetical protein